LLNAIRRIAQRLWDRTEKNRCY